MTVAELEQLEKRLNVGKKLRQLIQSFNLHNKAIRDARDYGITITESKTEKEKTIVVFDCGKEGSKLPLCYLANCFEDNPDSVLSDCDLSLEIVNFIIEKTQQRIAECERALANL
jgi:hypothetical protein